MTVSKARWPQTVLQELQPKSMLTGSGEESGAPRHRAVKALKWLKDFPPSSPRDRVRRDQPRDLQLQSGVVQQTAVPSSRSRSKQPQHNRPQIKWKNDLDAR